MSGTHHASPLTAVKGPDGRVFLAVDDLVRLLSEMAEAMPDAVLSKVLPNIAATLGAGPPPTSLPEPAARPCPSCGTSVREYTRMDDRASTVLLAPRPVPYGGWMATQTRDGWVAVAYETKHGNRVHRYREHTCVTAAAPGRSPI